MKTKKYKNERYFDALDSMDKFYLLGLIAADGNIDRGYAVRITLQEQDISILKKYAKILLGNENHLSRGNQSGRKPTYTLKISSKKMCEDLLKYGITERKSFTLDMPIEKFSPKEFKLFMLGLSDGDGSIFIKKHRQYQYLNFKLICSNKMKDKIVKLIKSILDVEFGYEEVRCKNNNSVASLRLQGKDKVKKFLTWMYSYDIECLDRKKQKFKSFNF
jgi:hypothetical protein